MLIRRSFATLFLSMFLTVLLTAPLASASPGIGDKFPDFSIPSLDGKKKVTNKDLKGKVVVIDMWASWCEPCKVEMPALDQMYAKLKKQGLHVIGVNLDENPSDAKAFLKDHPVKFPLAYDGKDKVLVKKLDIQTMPTSYILDRNGVVKHIHKGYYEGDIEKFEKEIGALLKQKK